MQILSTSEASVHLRELCTLGNTTGDYQQLSDYLCHWKGVIERAVTDNYPLHLTSEEITSIPLEERKTPSSSILQKLIDEQDSKVYQIITDTNNYYKSILGIDCIPLKIVPIYYITDGIPVKIEYTNGASEDDYILSTILKEVIDAVKIKDIINNPWFENTSPIFWFKMKKTEIIDKVPIKCNYQSQLYPPRVPTTIISEEDIRKRNNLMFKLYSIIHGDDLAQQ